MQLPFSPTSSTEPNEESPAPHDVRDPIVGEEDPVDGKDSSDEPPPQ
jgi:hypothetical protein